MCGRADEDVSATANEVEYLLRYLAMMSKVANMCTTHSRTKIAIGNLTEDGRLDFS